MSLLRLCQRIVALLVLFEELHALIPSGVRACRQNKGLQNANAFRVNPYHYQKDTALRTSESHHDETSSLSFDHLDDIPEIPKLYESDRILIVEKPPGIPHHNEEPNVPGIVTIVKHQQKKRVWGVHRLDKVTSGILIFAKDAEMASHLSTAFAEGRIQKVYVGISAKLKPKKKQGWVKGGMSRSRDKSWKLNRDPKAKENYAKTRFFTAKLLPNQSEQVQDDDVPRRKYSLILFRPYTGRTHQLRVAAKAMGIALLGDPIYKDGQEDIVPTRTYLHASGISIPSMDGEAEINLWNPPAQFESLVGEIELHSVLSTLMHKHCDIPGLLNALQDQDCE